MKLSTTDPMFPNSVRFRLAARLPFFYGWLMLPVATLAMIATSPGQTFIVSIFNPFFQETLQLSLSQVTGAYLVGTLLASFAQPYIGSLMDRFGIRRVMTAVVLLFGLVCILASQVFNLVTLFVAFLLLRMLGQGALSLLAVNTLPMWFSQRLGTVMGMMNVGVSISIGILPLTVLGIINQIGWRSTYVVLGVAVWLLMFPLLTFIFHDAPEQINQQIDGRFDANNPVQPTETVQETAAFSFTLRQAQKTSAYWIFLTISAAWALISTAVFFNLLSIFTTSGLTEQNAAATYLPFAVASASLQLLGGYLADRFPLHWLISGSMLLLVGAIGMLLVLQLPWHGLLYALLLGAGQGLFGAVGGTLWAKYFGTQYLGKIRGSISTAMVAGSSAGPFIMGIIFDTVGSYQIALLIFLLFAAVLVVVGFWTTKPLLPVESPTVS